MVNSAINIYVQINIEQLPKRKGFCVWLSEGKAKTVEAAWSKPKDGLLRQQ